MIFNDSSTTSPGVCLCAAFGGSASCDGIVACHIIPGTKGVLGCLVAYYRMLVESPRQVQAVRVLPKKQYRPKLVVCLLQNILIEM